MRPRRMPSRRRLVNCMRESTTLRRAGRSGKAAGRAGRRCFCVCRLVLRILDTSSEAQLKDARDLLAALREALVGFGAAAADQAALTASIRQLDELFLLVVVGEFNA